MKAANIRRVGFLIASVVTLSCFQNCSKANFNGASSTQDASALGGQVCGASGMTQVQLITPTTPNAQSGNYIDYQISLQTCDGQPMSFNNVAILFDINAIVQSTQDLQYTVTDGSSTFNGTLTDDSGTDLFGDTGAHYAHWSTGALQFSTAATTVTLRVYLGGALYLPNQAQYEGQTSATTDYVIPTYLQVGSSLAVTQNVTFTH